MAAYPLPLSFGGVVPYGPQWQSFIPAVIDYAVDTQLMQDNTTDRLSWSDTVILIFNFEYADLTEAEAAVLDAHYASTGGEFDSFAFHEPRTGTNYTAHYRSYKRGQGTGRWQQSRSVQLIVEL